ncbi:N-acetylmuramoyl-L-alanine amidase [Leuconostoc mesenteroides]|uniref:N-acetylmuramoyl-L-alanine amidase n=1 Tax=Leuconostoc mesenteroides TaxID=1245 RepID=UPI0021D24C70|nr:N-acetylmuramoyl-L-alanine amidase [Leuconostoc mesenteroides]MCU4664301.1 N-acetylmuramoyl-L-alanine amidase [Leuconostoc mesenteroides]
MMTKNINGDLYSDLITSADSRAMASGVIPRAKIDRIVIHHNATTNKDVAINTWLANGSAQTSAHYEVAGKQIIGIVGEGTTAWHAGDGNMNARSIGIENVNATGAPNWTISNDTFESLSKLVADIAKRYGFPIDATHVIPHKSVVSTACPGGIDVAKVIKRANEITGGKATTSSSQVNSATKPDAIVSAIQQFKNAGNHFTNTKTFKVDKIAKVNGIWQMINYNLAGGKDADWTNNGIPLDIVDNVTRGMSPTQVGDVMKFSAGYDNGTIDKYDTATNGVGIVFGKYGIIWFNADAFIKL